MDYDYFIFSSHKTGTQSIVNTFKKNGLNAVHLHSTRNFGLSSDSFRDILRKRNEKGANRPIIITNFRLPIERHISSFFQWNGVGVLRKDPNLKEEDTVISKFDVGELNELFVSNLKSTKFVGYAESIHEIFNIFFLKPSDLSAGFTPHSFQISHELADIYFFRFDELFKDFSATLSSIIQITLKEYNANISSEKWYSSKLLEFKNNLQIPPSVIEETYRYRKDLINLYYPGSYESLKDNDAKTYRCK